MRLNAKLDMIDASTFIQDYLLTCGIENPEEYINADKRYFEDWHKYKDIDKAVALIKKVVDTKPKCGILVDCDFDGIASAAIAYDILVKHDIVPIVYIRQGKAHGLRMNKEKHEDIVQQMIDDEIKFLWIPDAGTNDNKECDALAENGCEVLITDHHVQTVKNESAIVINNQIADGLNKELTGAGVTWKTVTAFCETYNEVVNPKYLSLVATSLVSDMVDFTALENRAIWNEGFKEENLNNFIGYLNYKLNKGDTITSETVGWQIAPLVNAASREDDTERFRTIFESVVGIVTPDVGLAAGRKSKSVQNISVALALPDVRESILDGHGITVAFCDNKDAGYTGLLANKLLGEMGTPVAVLRKVDGWHYSGSLRSPVPLLKQINKSKFATAQGHDKACGIVLKSKALAKFLTWSDTIEIDNNPSIDVAGIISPKDVTEELCGVMDENKTLWNKGIDLPQFAITMTIKPNAIASFRKKAITIKFHSNDASFLLFHATEDDVTTLQKGGRFTFIVVLSNTEYRGTVTPTARIIRYEKVDETLEDLW